MNKMRTISDMRARVQQIIEKEIAKTEKEIADFEEKIHDNEAYYGGGGWYTQFTKAKERREAYLEELKAFSKSSSGASVITDEVYIHSYYCPSCHIKVMLTAGFGEKVECPVCTRPIYKANSKRQQASKGTRALHRTYQRRQDKRLIRKRGNSNGKKRHSNRR